VFPARTSKKALRLNRKLDDAERFSIAVSGIVGKRVIWNQVTGKELDSSIVN